MGFIINYEKSVLNPTKELLFLGFVFSSEDMSIKLPEEKSTLIQNLLVQLKNKRFCTIRQFASLVGKLVASDPTLKYGWLHIRPFEIVKQKYLMKNHMNFNARMTIPTSLNSEINWWLYNISYTKKFFSQLIFALEIYSDASKRGWGGWSSQNNLEARGFWNQKQIFKHINYLELKAIFNSLKSLTKHKL